MANTTQIKGNKTTDGDLTANAFITSGGVSTDFVKGDGTLDSNTYLSTSLIEGQFLRSDVTDHKTNGGLVIDDTVRFDFGTDGDIRMQFTGTNLIQNHIAGDYLIQDNGTTRFTFGRTTGIFTTLGTGSGELIDLSTVGNTAASLIELRRNSQVGMFFNDTTAPRYLGTSGGDLYWGTTANHSTNDLVMTEANIVSELTTLNSFLRSDVADTKTAGDLTISENVFLRFGTTHSTLGSTAVQTQLNLVNQDFKILDNSSTRFTFGRTTGDLALTSINGLTQNQFLRADENDFKTTGYLRFQDNINAEFGTSSDLKIYSNNTNSVFDLLNFDLKIKDGGVDRFTFGRTTGDLTNTGNIISQGTGDNSFVGNVGIGTTSPGTMLSIYDSTARMELNDTDGTSQLAYIEHSNGITGIISRNNTSNGKFQIRGWNGTATTNFVTVDASGNVGIGTAAPSSKLHVLGTTSTEKLQIFNVALAETFFEVGDGEIGSILYSMERSPSGGVTNEIALKAEFGPLTLWGGSGGTPTRVMSLLNSGNVGIGTTNPITNLTLGTGTDGISFQSSLVTFNSGKIGVIKPVEVGNGNGHLLFETYEGGSGGGERMRIASGGNVGIGYSVPSAQLHIRSASDEVVRIDHSSATGSPYISFHQANTRRGYIQHVDSGDKLRINSQYGAMEFMTDSAGTGILRMTIDSSGDVEMKGNLIWAQTLLNKTASYALLAADIGTCLTTSGASNINFTVNTGSMTAIGHTIEVDHAGTGTCTIVAGASVTLQINSNDTLVLDGQYSRVMIQKMAGTNTFRVFGQLTPA